MGLVLILNLGVMATDLQSSSGSVQVVGTVFLFFIILCCSAALFVGMVWRLRPRPYYDYFVCHHKGHAAAQARLIKMLLTQRSQCNVFIDSDDLFDLDTLFDTVRCKLGHLLVYLTRDTLSRPWCAGEITTAFSVSRVKVTAIYTPCFVAPTDEQLEKLDSFLDMTSCNLADYHMSWSVVAEAIRKLLSEDTPQILSEFFAVGGTRRFDRLVSDVLGMQATNSRLRAVLGMGDA